MRALRVWHWLAAPSFWEQPLAESNYPFGEILHWTRPMDILWAVNAIPFCISATCATPFSSAGRSLPPGSASCLP